MFVKQNSFFIKEMESLTRILTTIKLETDTPQTLKLGASKTFLTSLPEFQIRNKLNEK